MTVEVRIENRECTNVPEILEPSQDFRGQKGYWSKFHTQDPKILRATVQNLVARATSRPGFVHPREKRAEGSGRDLI
jgi:hypothetical protein